VDIGRVEVYKREENQYQKGVSSMGGTETRDERGVGVMKTRSKQKNRAPEKTRDINALPSLAMKTTQHIYPTD
jgi:hypothetical protein